MVIMFQLSKVIFHFKYTERPILFETFRIAGSALCALEGKNPEIGSEAIVKLLEEVIVTIYIYMN